jgi:transposase
LRDVGVIEDSTGHTSGRMTGRIEVVSRVSGRRYWTVDQKLGMLRDAFGPGGSVRLAMDRHELTSGLLYTWRKQAMSGLLFDRPVAAVKMAEPQEFAEVHLLETDVQAEPALPEAALPCLTSGGSPPGRIGIELPSGVRVNVDAAVDAEALGRVLSVLTR